MYQPRYPDLCIWSPHALDLLEVNEEFEDLEADTQAEGRETEGGHQEEASA